jgi:hypothetical protein
MNLLNILHEIEQLDPEVYERLDQRRTMFKHFAGFGKKLATAAVPLAMGAMFQKAYGQSSGLSQQIKDVLNFALTLEYLEAIFYNQGVNMPGLLSGQDKTDITLITYDEYNHIKFLRSVLGADARTPLTANNFDYTGSKGGTRAALLPDVFTNRATFLALAQAFEDTGVRAYKGGAPLLISNNTVLEAALNIHSVEARHAARLRTMRRGGPQALPGSPQSAPKSWISGNDGGGPAPAITAAVYGPGTPAAMYPSEANTVQGGLELMSTFATASQASEAFDEPLDVATVLAIASNFIK